MNAVLTYNQDLAVKAGGGEYLSEGGAHIVTITQAKYIKSKKDTQGIEFSVVTKDGLKANYLNVYYAKASLTQGVAGEPITGGLALLNAMMGLLQVRAMTAIKQGADYIAPEFAGKAIGLFLQKKLSSKMDGSDSYNFEIVVPFNAVDGKTMREIVDNRAAQTIERMARAYKDRDERKTTSTTSSTSTQSAGSGFGSYDEYTNSPNF